MKKIMLSIVLIGIIGFVWLVFVLGVIFQGLPLIAIDIFEGNAAEYLCGANVCTDAQYSGYIVFVMGQILIVFIVPPIILIYLLVRRWRKSKAE